MCQTYWNNNSSLSDRLDFVSNPIFQAAGLPISKHFQSFLFCCNIDQVPLNFSIFKFQQPFEYDLPSNLVFQDFVNQTTPQ